MSRDFDELPWHDAQLLSVSIDRTQAGHRDEVRLAIRWPDETDAVVLFQDVYAFHSRMNFGVIADETILSASVVRDGDELASIKSRWAKLGVVLDDLRCFELETASTASTLRIFARAFAVTP